MLLAGPFLVSQFNDSDQAKSSSEILSGKHIISWEMIRPQLWGVATLKVDRNMEEN